MWREEDTRGLIIISNMRIHWVDTFGSMLKNTTRCYSRFVPRYEFPKYNIINSDFKGHQLKALKKFEYLAPQLSMILELRDLRAPISTRNVLFDKVLMSGKYHIKRLVVYTKKDLMSHDKMYLDKLTKWHDEINESFIIIDSRSRNDTNNLMRIIQWHSDEIAKAGMSLPMGFRALVTGVPNLGKSTLVNSLRSIYNKRESSLGKRKKVARTGSEAGVTRSTSECIRISKGRDHTSQPIYLIDTPGIGLPGRATNDKQVLALSLCGSLKSNLVDPIIVADYLLYLMNLQDCESENEWYPNCIQDPTNDVYELLTRLNTGGARDDTQIASNLVNKWSRTGKNLVFDAEMLLNSDEFSYRDYLRSELSKLEEFTINNSNYKQNTKARNRDIFL